MISWCSAAGPAIAFVQNQRAQAQKVAKLANSVVGSLGLDADDGVAAIQALPERIKIFIGSWQILGTMPEARLDRCCCHYSSFG